MIKAVLFDLDGTLFDSSSGIFHTANHTMKELGFEECHDVNQLRKFVGPPLRECFRITFGTKEEYLDECVEVYRKEYRKTGMHMCYPYPGIIDLLKELRKYGIKTGVCTLKYETLAVDIIKEKGMFELFDVIFGTDSKGKITKADSINNAVNRLGVSPCDVLMVGDTLNDLNGAKEAGVNFCGVTWGFGFEKPSDVNLGFAATNTNDIIKYVKKENQIMDIKKISTTKAPAAIGPYSQAVAVGDFVFCSGQIPINPATGLIVEGTADEQAKQCFENIKAVLEEAGTDITKVIKATVFLKDMADFVPVNEVYAEAFKESEVLPARSAVQVAKLPKDVKVEIEVIAVK